MFIIRRSSSLLASNTNNFISTNGGRTFSTSVYEQLRRKRDRKGLVNTEALKESDTAIFPNERSGLDYELNWTLNGYSVTPMENAYRNPSLKLLFQQSNGKKESNGALSVQLETEAKAQNVFLDEAVAKVNNGKTISIAQYKQLLKVVKDHISDHENIYVHDAAIGSSRSCEALVRAITPNANASLILSHLLPRTHVVSPKEFKHPVTIYLAPDFVLEQPQQYGLEGSSFNIIDVKRGIAVIAGSRSSENIKNVISSIAQPHLLTTNQALTTSADIFLTKDDKTFLIFNDGYLLNKKFESGSVVSQGSIWNNEGLSRSFDSISYPLESAARKPFDLIERFSSPKKVVSTSPLDFNTNSYKLPSSVVFLVKDSKGVIPAFSELNVEQAEKYFASGFNGESFNPFYSHEQVSVSPKAKAELFKNLVQQNGTTVYIINTHSFQKDADVDKLLSVISSGKVNKPQANDVYSTLSQIKLSETKVSDVDKKKVKEFETNFNDVVSKLLSQ